MENRTKIDNTKTSKYRVASMLGIILAALPSAFPLFCILHTANSILHGNGSDDAAGWAFLFLIVIVIGILPALGTTFLPLIIFIVCRIKKRLGVLGKVVLIFCNIFVIAEMFFFNFLTDSIMHEYFIHQTIFGVMVYIILSVIDAFLLSDIA